MVGRFLYVTGKFCGATFFILSTFKQCVTKAMSRFEAQRRDFWSNVSGLFCSGNMLGIAESHVTHGMTHLLGLSLTMNLSCSLKR